MKLPPLYIAVANFGLAIGITTIFFPWLGGIATALTIPTICFVLYKLNARREEDLKKTAQMLSEAGAAITDTMKVAFDNLKKVSGSATKSQSKVSDHEARLHRLEQHLHKSMNDTARQQAIRQQAMRGGARTRQETNEDGEI